MDILLVIVCGGLVGFLKFYTMLLTLRIYLTWFPNINFYAQPFFSMTKITDPYLRAFRGIIPTLIGFDLSPLLAFALLTFLIDFFSSAASSGALF